MARPEFTNWGRNHTCVPSTFQVPTSEREVEQVLAQALDARQTVKVVGAGHSWSNAACTSGHMISLDGLDRVLDVDDTRHRVTVGAGIRLHRLIERLAGVGLALQNIGSVTQQSIAGAFSTGTHGTGLRFGCLATQVVGMRMLSGDGQWRHLSAERSPELFAAARVNLGMLGVITEVTLQAEPLYDLEERVFALPFEEARARMMELVDAHEHVKFWWMPHTDQLQVFTYDRTSRPRTPPSLSRTLEEQVLNRWGFAALLGVGHRFPAIIPPTNRLVASGYMRSMRRVDRGDRLLSLAMPPVHREMEYGIPVERAAELVGKVRRMIDHHGLRVNFPLEVRFVAADRTLLSPAAGRTSCQVGAYIGEGSDRARFFQLFEQLAVDFEGRPHWGKEFSLRRRQLAAAWPGFERFDAIRRQLDPDKVFVNDFSRQVFGD